MVTGHIGVLQTGVGYNSGSKLILITFFMAKLYKNKHGWRFSRLVAWSSGGFCLDCGLLLSPKISIPNPYLNPNSTVDGSLK